jgi:hypothetical protein
MILPRHERTQMLPLRPALVIVLSVVIGPGAVSTLAQPRAHTVLVVLPGSDDPGYAVTNAAIREALHSRSDVLVDYFREYLDVDHLAGEDAAVGLRESILREFRSRPIDVVIAHTTPVRVFVLRFRDELFPCAAILFQGMGDIDGQLHDSGVTGIDTAAGIQRTLDFALTQHPSTRDSRSSTWMREWRSDTFRIAG